MMLRLFRPALCLLVAMTCVLGIAYPLLITGIARLAFPSQAAGSLVYQGAKAIGSSLIGQQFSDPKYFWGRPSATTPGPYNGLASSGSNLGPLNPALRDQVRVRVASLRADDPKSRAPVPVDLVTASASGLDPDISPAGARYQIGRIARARGIAPASLEKLVAAHEQGKLFGLLGEQRVNVLELNLALDQLR
jgi:potassium-transporting ATPase KdpC subunit